MAQETPSNLLYAQALIEIQKLRQQYSTSKFKTPQDISELVNNTLSKFIEKAGKTLTQYEPIQLSEIPSSEKMNRFWTALQADVNILQDQLDLLNASTVFEHNFIKTEILKAKRENLRLQNKVKTLGLYANISDESLIYLGDTFISEDFIDWGLVSLPERATLLASGHISLRVSEQESAINTQTVIRVLNNSNGFFGNNQEIADPKTALIDPISGRKLYRFISETSKRGDLRHILDSKPNTWFEFEKYLIKEDDRLQAKNFNFDYVLNFHETTNHLTRSNATINESNKAINWADGIADGVLKFYFEVDLGVDRQVNLITLNPFGLTDNRNNPIKISKVSTSINKTDWTILSPEKVWISNSIDKKISAIDAENIVIGMAAWSTPGDIVRYIRFEIEQPRPVACNIGHLYYVDKTSPAANTPNYSVELPTSTVDQATYGSNIPYGMGIGYGGSSTIPSNDGSGYSDSVMVDNGSSYVDMPQSVGLTDVSHRKQGPIPPAENPQVYFSAGNSIVNNLIQKREYFRGKRWVIGIRDIEINTNFYDTKGVIVSKRFETPRIIDRVALEADISIPFGWDSSINWIKFYISPDDGSSWFPISRIQDDFLNIPEILAFNDPTPADLREPGVAYHFISGSVKSVRLKIELTRPTDAHNATPILKSYKLKIIQRN